MKLQFDVPCRDIEAQLAFYRAVLGLTEAAYTRSPVYRALHTPTFQFGFRAAAAPATVDAGGEPTFVVETAQEVDALATRAAAHGGRVVSAPAATGTGQWLTVLADPEGRMFRAASDELP